MILSIHMECGIQIIKERKYMKIDIGLSSEKDATIWRSPVETVSLSEAGFERVYQSSSVVFIWDIQLDTMEQISIIQFVKSL